MEGTIAAVVQKLDGMEQRMSTLEVAVNQTILNSWKAHLGKIENTVEQMVRRWRHIRVCLRLRTRALTKQWRTE